MSSVMKAHQFTHPSRGLEFNTIPIPQPGPNQVLVKVKAAGLCYTDYNLVSGKDDSFMFRRPIILGHEIAGIVTQTGSDVTALTAGDRVVAVIDTKCPATLSGVATGPGIGIDGGFAEYVLLYEHKALLMPENISFADAAVAADAVSSAYHAVVTLGQVTASSKVAIIGLGGLGMCAAQIAANIVGAEVYGIDTDSKKFSAAIGFGVKSCAKSFAGLPGKRFDVIVDFAGAGITTSSAVPAINRRNHCFAKNVTLKGSTASATEEIKICMDLIAQNKFKTLLEKIPFSDIAGGIDRLAKGKTLGRLWADPSKR